jgi:hypothetical protein
LDGESFGFALASEAARTAAMKIQQGLAEVADMRVADRQNNHAATSLLEKLSDPLVAAVGEYVRCRKLLGGSPLLSAIEEHVRRTNGLRMGASVADVVKEFMAAKEEDGVSKRYLAQLRSDLNRFTEFFRYPILRVKSELIDEWLRSIEFAPHTPNGTLTSVRTLFSFAKSRSYLPKNEITEADALNKSKVGDTDTVIFEPAVMRKLLNAASPQLIPFLAIGTFAGLRSAEIARLEWSAINFARGIIDIRAGKATHPVTRSLLFHFGCRPLAVRFDPSPFVLCDGGKQRTEFGIGGVLLGEALDGFEESLPFRVRLAVGRAAASADMKQAGEHFLVALRADSAGAGEKTANKTRMSQRSIIEVARRAEFANCVELLLGRCAIGSSFQPCRRIIAAVQDGRAQQPHLVEIQLLAFDEAVLAVGNQCLHFRGGHDAPKLDAGEIVGEWFERRVAGFALLASPPEHEEHLHRKGFGQFLESVLQIVTLRLGERFEATEESGDRLRIGP